MSMNPPVSRPDRQAWRAWLQDNHERCTEVWLVFHNKHTGKSGITCRAEVEEATCHGSIDGLKRRLKEALRLLEENRKLGMK